ncbi:MAG TPA: hypothetical protein VFT30_01790, partial [Nitrospira sp.]|nr:hypothetical protein [Nitrospira sp.]
PLLLNAIEGVEVNEKVKDILDAVVAAYGTQDSGTITSSVESIQLSTPLDPELKIPIRDIVFHTTLLVPHRIEVQAEVAFSPAIASKLNAAMGYDSRPVIDAQSW